MQDNLGNSNFQIENTKFPNFNNIQLEGRQFEDVSSFFKEIFLKKKQTHIWEEQIEGGKTVREFVKERIDSYSDEITEKINESGIKDKIKMYLKKLNSICVEPIYNHRDLNIDAKVKFLEGGNNEIIRPLA